MKKPDAWDIVTALLEGKDDTKYREWAGELADEIGKATTHVVPTVEKHDGDDWVVYDMDDVLADLKVAFVLLAPGHEANTGAAMTTTHGHSKMLTMSFKDQPELRKGWKQHVRHHAPNIVKINHDVFVHELIHAFDRERIKSKPAFKQQVQKASAGGDADYYNNPLELNAFIQQGLSKMVSQLKQQNTPETRRVLMGDTPQKFFQRLTSHYMNKNFIKNLTPVNRQKLAKRAYQLWGELVKSQST